MKKSEQLKAKTKTTFANRLLYTFTESELQEYASEIAKEAYPNIKKNDIEICGKCGTVI